MAGLHVLTSSSTAPKRGLVATSTSIKGAVLRVIGVSTRTATSSVKACQRSAKPVADTPIQVLSDRLRVAIDAPTHLLVPPQATTARALLGPTDVKTWSGGPLKRKIKTLRRQAFGLT